MSEFFPKPTLLGGNVKGQEGLSNYVAKTDLQKVVGVDISDFAKNADSASLKLEVDKFDMTNQLNQIVIG